MFKHQSTQTSNDNKNIEINGYYSQLKIQDSGCLNCKAYALWVDDSQNIIKPCANCAQLNNYIWNGVQCLGISYSLSEKKEQTLEEFIWTFKNIIQPRFEGREKELNEYVDKLPENIKYHINS